MSKEILKKLLATPKEIQAWNDGFKEGKKTKAEIEITALLKKLSRLEREVEKRPKARIEIGHKQVCDAPKCMKMARFQAGINSMGKIGNWCSEVHCNNYEGKDLLSKEDTTQK